MYVPMVSLWFAAVSRRRSRFDFGRCISVIDLVVEGEKCVVDCCGLLGREVLLVEDWCRLKVWMYYDLCGKVVVAAFESKVLLLQSWAMKLHKLFQLAYDVHTCRMIPRLVIILEGDMCTSGNVVTNSRVTPSWREIVSLTF
nr:hypothetical protein [Tanacetum cinerariifolium]